jgi:hypothetical protein
MITRWLDVAAANWKNTHDIDPYRATEDGEPVTQMNYDAHNHFCYGHYIHYGVRVQNDIPVKSFQLLTDTLLWERPAFVPSQEEPTGSVLQIPTESFAEVVHS